MVKKCCGSCGNYTSSKTLEELNYSPVLSCQHKAMNPGNKLETKPMINSAPTWWNRCRSIVLCVALGGLVTITSSIFATILMIGSSPLSHWLPSPLHKLADQWLIMQCMCMWLESCIPHGQRHWHVVQCCTKRSAGDGTNYCSHVKWLQQNSEKNN